MCPAPTSRVQPPAPHPPQPQGPDHPREHTPGAIRPTVLPTGIQNWAVDRDHPKSLPNPSQNQSAQLRCVLPVRAVTLFQGLGIRLCFLGANRATLTSGIRSSLGAWFPLVCCPKALTQASEPFFQTRRWKYPRGRSPDGAWFWQPVTAGTEPGALTGPWEPPANTNPSLPRACHLSALFSGVFLQDWRIHT